MPTRPIGSALLRPTACGGCAWHASQQHEHAYRHAPGSGFGAGGCGDGGTPNRKGNREALPIRTLHDDLLASAGGDWRSPPEAVVWRPVHRLLRDGLIERFADQPLWGFKDPRSLFCLEGWREALPQMEAVAIVRHPLEVAASLQARDGLPLAEGVVLWERYNRRLLYWIEELDCPLLVFEPEAEVIKQKLAGLIKRLDLPRQLGPEELRFFAGELRHQGHAARELGILPASVRQLHQQLLERAFQA